MVSGVCLCFEGQILERSEGDSFKGSKLGFGTLLMQVGDRRELNDICTQFFFN